MRLALVLGWCAAGFLHNVTGAAGGEVTGRVQMPATCAPTISPAVVRLEPVGGELAAAAETPTADAPQIDQKGLRFQPRVAVVQRGRPIRFGNSDPESHNIHIQDDAFNQTIRPGQQVEYIPRKAGVLTVLCDIHSHMRAFIIVGESPWIACCAPDGHFRFRDVPAGRYRLIAWHEMGDPVRREVAIEGEKTDLGTLELLGRAPAAGPDLARNEPWHEVVGRISETLAASLAAASQPGGRARALTLAQDAYFAEFEASDMEAAVRSYLGMGEAGRIEAQFRDVIRAAPALAAGRKTAQEVAERHRKLLADLVAIAHALDAKGITDRSKISSSVAIPTADALPSSGPVERAEQLRALAAAFARVRSEAETGDPATAAAILGDEGYFGAFEPLELELQVREPGSVKPLEARFNTLRGEIGRGLKGPELAARLDGLRADIEAAIRRIDARPSGGFGLAFIASLGTILREGVEVILLLTMLLALVSRSGRPDLLPAIRWGVGAAVAASLLTALGLNLLVRSSAGRTQELIEGLVLLAASGVLFYVSYWLISHSESKRWMDFLKRQAGHGMALGGTWTLGLTAFLAVYREGAETALMYQSMIALNRGSQPGMIGLLAGLGVGLVILAVLYWLVRVTSVRLPLRAFFQVTGGLLFAMSVVFAGHAVFELQSAEFIKTTPLPWLGSGLPVLGLYANVQCVSVQAILLVGALAAGLLMALGRRPGTAEGRPSGAAQAPAPTAGARV
jgi:high-affinity iron transporter